MKMIKLSVVGLGLMGKQHVAAINDHPNCSLDSIIDSNDDVRALAASEGCFFYSNINEALSKTRPDGLIISTPNAHHFEDGLAGLKHGIPILVEKPI